MVSAFKIKYVFCYSRQGGAFIDRVCLIEINLLT